MADWLLSERLTDFAASYFYFPCLLIIVSKPMGILRTAKSMQSFLKLKYMFLFFLRTVASITECVLKHLRLKEEDVTFEYEKKKIIKVKFANEK